MIKSLHFVLEEYVWDQEQRRLVVVYRSHTDGRVTSCVELMQFDPDGKQIYGRAYYGAAHLIVAPRRTSFNRCGVIGDSVIAPACGWHLPPHWRWQRRRL
jgi:hypothetical protein